MTSRSKMFAVENNITSKALFWNNRDTYVKYFPSKFCTVFHFTCETNRTNLIKVYSYYLHDMCDLIANVIKRKT